MKDINEALHSKLKDAACDGYVNILDHDDDYAVLDGWFDIGHLELILEQLKSNRDKLKQ